MSFAKFLALLKTKSLFFARADVLAALDPFEGRLTHLDAEVHRLNWKDAPESFWSMQGFSNAEEWERFRQIRLSMEARIGKTNRELAFISCWYRSAYESDAMWRLYAGVDGGVCVQSTLGRLKEAVSVSRETVYIGMVRYLDYRVNQIEDGNLFSRFISKRSSFQHENELRAVVYRFEDTEYQYAFRDGKPASKDRYDEAYIINKYPDRRGIGVDVVCETLIEKVYISPLSGNWFRDLASGLAEDLGYRFSFIHSELSEQPSL